MLLEAESGAERGIVRSQRHCSAFPFELKETGEFHTPLAGVLLGCPGRGLLQLVKKAWP